MIPYGKQDISQSDIDAVVEVLQSDFLTQGPKVPAFEQCIANYCGVAHVISVNSATSALHIACLALGLEKGSRLWTSTISFVASANCGLYCGAEVDFVDIDPLTYNLSVDALQAKLILAESTNKLPDVLVVVHLCGQSCEMEDIYRLSKRYGFKIIEDASHAIGGKYKGYAIGSCKYSDITVFSFHPVKIVTTAEGGVATTNDKSLAEKMALYRSHGITRNTNQMTHEPDGPWYYQQIELGYNYRMTDLQAALGISQMARVDEFVSARHALAEGYNKLLKDCPVITPWQHPDSYSGLHLYVIRLQLDKISVTHKQVFEYLRDNGVCVNLHYIPIHTQPYYQQLDSTYDSLEESARYYSEAISLPMYHLMTIEQQAYVVSKLKDVLTK